MPTEVFIYSTSLSSDRRILWLAERQTGIGGSDSAAALGKSPWKSRFQLWSEKVGLTDAPDLSENEAVEWGLRLEGPIATAYSQKSGRCVLSEPQYTIRRHPDYNWLMASLDATQEADDKPGVGILQIKTTSAWNDDDWKEEPPPYYQIQLQHEMAVTGAKWGTLCVLIGGQKMRWFDQDRNEKFIATLIAQEQAFWLLVKSETPPEVDGSDETAAILKKLYPIDNGETIALPDEAAEWDEKLLAIKEQLKDLEATKGLLDNNFRAAIGNAAIGMLRDGTAYTYKTQTVNHPPKEAYTSTFRVLRRRKVKE